jgi:predicted acylesterase/phospholipase RssA/CRP-like cAMP-binding protein
VTRVTTGDLSRVRLFDGVTEEVLQEIADMMAVRQLDFGAWIDPDERIDRDDPLDARRRLGVVLVGALSVFSNRAAPEPMGVVEVDGSYGAWTLLGGGTRSGELRAATGELRAATGEVPAMVTVGELSGEQFDALADRHQRLRDTVLRNATLELHELELQRAIRSGWGIYDVAAIKALSGLATVREIASGEVLMRKGDPATSAFLVLAGSFRVSEASSTWDSSTSTVGTESVSPMLGPGHIVGERALLDHGLRSATLTAMRSSRVAEFESGAFQNMCLDHPKVLLRTVGEFIRRLDSNGKPTVSNGHRIALIGDGTVDVAAFAQRLAAAFPQRIEVVDSQDVASGVGLCDDDSDTAAALNVGRLGAWLDRRTEDSPWLLLVADPRDRRWTSACLSYGDHLVALTEKSTSIPNRHPAWPDGVARLQRTTLVFVHPISTRMPSDTARILSHLPATDHLHVRIDRDEDIARVARTLAGVPYGLVLSGGGARGFAHLGAVRAMRELNIPCDIVGGTSIGAVMAMYQGMDMTVEEQLRQTEVGFKGLNDFTLPVVSLLKGQRTSERIQQHVGEHTIEDLWVPYFCVSTNLSTNDMKIHDRGSIATAVRSSLALPGIFPPVHDGEHFLVDGGVLNNFPLDVMRARIPFGKVIAIDVAANMLLDALGNFGLQLSGWRAAAAILRRKPLAPSIATTLVRTSVIGSARDRDRYLRMRYADLHMELALKDCGLLDFGAVRAVAKYGYDAALPQLTAWWNSPEER